MTARAGRARTARAAALAAALIAAVLAVSGCGGQRGANEVRLPLGAGGVGFLPLLMMREHDLIEKHARAAGLEDLDVRWIELGGPAVVNDALLSGSVDFIAAGPPGFLTLWDRTYDSIEVRGVGAIAALPMYLNTRAGHLSSLEDLAEQDKIAVTAVKVSIPAIVMQMYARERHGLDEATRFDRYTVTMTHPDGVVALLSGRGEITAHYTSPPFHHREREDPEVRTIQTTDDVVGPGTTFTMLSTTARYRAENPVAYEAVLAALREANEMIGADLEHAAEVLHAADGGAGFTAAELVDVLRDPDIEFKTEPANVVRYAQFMHEIGSIEHLPESSRDLFFPELYQDGDD